MNGKQPKSQSSLTSAEALRERMDVLLKYLQVGDVVDLTDEQANALVKLARSKGFRVVIETVNGRERCRCVRSPGHDASAPAREVQSGASETNRRRYWSACR